MNGKRTLTGRLLSTAILTKENTFFELEISHQGHQFFELFTEPHESSELHESSTLQNSSELNQNSSRAQSSSRAEAR